MEGGEPGPYETPDGYHILKSIGEGGMGCVYLAQRSGDKDTGRVALKLIHPWFVRLDGFRNRFAYERKALAVLKTHPNIVHLEDAGTTHSGIPFLATEYIDGTPVGLHCSERNMAIDERLRLFLDICEAVEFAHRNLIIHRDIKPSNLLIDRAGKPKLLDFGLAKLLEGETEGEATAVLPGARLGTLAYASPEQVTAGPIAVPADIYSLAVVLYELLTGCSPYGPERREERLAQLVREQEPPLASAVTAGVRPEFGKDADPARRQRKLRGDLDNVLAMALRKDPKHRHGSVEKFAADIRSYLEQRPVSARPQSLGYRLRKGLRRHRVAAATTLAFLAVLLTATALVARNAQIAERERRRAEQRLQDVHALANSLVFEIHDAVQNLSGATAAREVIVSKGLEHLDRVSKEAGGDPTLELELMGSYVRIGDVQGYPNGANRGDIRAALRSYEKALAIGNAAPRTTAISDSLDQRLSVVHQRIGEVTLQLGKAKEALGHQEMALGLLRRFEGNAGARFEIRQTLATAHLKRGEVLESMGQYDNALAEYRIAKPMVERHFAERPNEPEVRRYASVIHTRFGDILRIQGKPEQALAEYRAGLPLREQAAASDKNNAEARRDLATSYDRIAMALAESGRAKEGLEWERKSLDIDAKLAAEDDRNIDAKHDLANDHQSLGQLYTITEQFPEALASHEAAVGIREKLALLAPDNEEWLGELAQGRGFVAVTLSRVRQHARALAMCERAIEAAERLRDQSNATFQELKANLYAAAGEIAMEGGARYANAALRWMEKARTAYRVLKAEGTLTSDGAAQLTKVEAELARRRR